MWYVQGGTVAVRTVRLGTRNSELGVRDLEFLSVVRSTADRLRETCGALWMSIPTQMGFSHYTVRAQNNRNMANPRPGLVRQMSDRLPTAQYMEVKRQKEKFEAQKNLEQHKVLFELKRAREREYYKVEEFLIDLELNFVKPQV